MFVKGSKGISTSRVTQGSFTLRFSRNRAWESPLTRLFLSNHNVVATYGYTNKLLAVIAFQTERSSHRWLSLWLKLNRLSPSLHCLSATSSLLRLSPPPLSRAIHYTYNGRKTHRNDSDFSCSLQKPVLKSCQLTPDVMQSLIRSPIALGHRYKRNYLFSTSLYYITRLQSLIHSIQLINNHLRRSSPRFSLSFTTTPVSNVAA